jgi:sarcosine oxidase
MRADRGNLKTSKVYDVAVIGLGAMGSAAVYHLARRGARVLGLDRFEPGHDRGSSHGATRIIRLGYYEHPSYVPLLRRAYQLWRDLETAAGQRLLHVTGIAEIGRPDGELVQGTLATARLHALPHEVLDARALMRRYPPFHLPPDFLGVVQPDGGFLTAEPAVQAHQDLAQKAGAELRFGETVLGIEHSAREVRITTGGGVVTVGTAIVAAGAWTKKLLPALAMLRVTRQVMAWFTPADPACFAPERFPVFMLESRLGIHYGFPLDENGLKVSKHFHQDETVDPDIYSRAVTPEDHSVIRSGLAYLPAANGPLRIAKTCLYTMTPDGDFIIDRLPAARNILVASPCSGHGFKFSPVIGEILADLAIRGKTAHDISRFRLARFR